MKNQFVKQLLLAGSCIMFLCVQRIEAQNCDISTTFDTLLMNKTSLAIISKLGLKHTPKGKMHGIIVFVDFLGSATTADSLWREGDWRWKWDSLPNWAQGQSNYLLMQIQQPLDQNLIAAVFLK